jgi:Flp pilus assembly protein TadG
MMLYKIKTFTSEKGQSMLELAVGIMILFVFLAGIIDIGRAIFHFIAMRDAAQEAAVYGAVYSSHCDQIRDRAYSAMNNSPAIQIITTVDGMDCSEAIKLNNKVCYGKEIRVTVRDPEFPLSMPFIGAFLGRQTIPLEAFVTGTILRPPCN